MMGEKLVDAGFDLGSSTVQQDAKDFYFQLRCVHI